MKNEMHKEIRLLVDTPSSEDKFGIHQRLLGLLKTAIEQLSESNLCVKTSRNLIGLFGAWGSGKSTLIKLFEKETGYQVFTFDSWSHKDDFIKRAFLLELAGALAVSGEEYEDSIKFQDYLSRRIVKKNFYSTIGTKQKIAVSFIALVLFLNVLGFNVEWFKVLVTKWWDKIWLLPANLKIIFIFVLTGISFAFLKYLWWPITEWFVLRKFDVNESNLALENYEFTNYDFSRALQEIVRRYVAKKPKDRILIVFDNLDRVDDQTVLRVISMIQSIQDGCPGSDSFHKSVFFLVPIDEKRLRLIFGGMVDKQSAQGSGSSEMARPCVTNQNVIFSSDYIEKLFPYIVRIPDMKQAEWRAYFRDRIEEALGAILPIDGSERTGVIDVVSEIFYEAVLRNRKVLSPREIIHFINELAINVLYWREEITIVNQAIYVILTKYFPEAIESGTFDQDPLRAAGEWMSLGGYSADMDSLRASLLQQKYKVSAKDVYELIYRDRLVIALKTGDAVGVAEILKDVPEDKHLSLFRSGYFGVGNTFAGITNSAYVLYELDVRTHKTMQMQIEKDLVEVLHSSQQIGNISDSCAKGLREIMVHATPRALSYIKPRISEVFAGVIVKDPKGSSNQNLVQKLEYLDEKYVISDTFKKELLRQMQDSSFKPSIYLSVFSALNKEGRLLSELFDDAAWDVLYTHFKQQLNTGESGVSHIGEVLCDAILYMVRAHKQSIETVNDILNSFDKNWNALFGHSYNLVKGSPQLAYIENIPLQRMLLELIVYSWNLKGEAEGEEELSLNSPYLASGHAFQVIAFPNFKTVFSEQAVCASIVSILLEYGVGSSYNLRPPNDAYLRIYSLGDLFRGYDQGLRPILAQYLQQINGNGLLYSYLKYLENSKADATYSQVVSQLLLEELSGEIEKTIYIDFNVFISGHGGDEKCDVLVEKFHKENPGWFKPYLVKNLNSDSAALNNEAAAFISRRRIFNEYADAEIAEAAVQCLKRRIEGNFTVIEEEHVLSLLEYVFQKDLSLDLSYLTGADWFKTKIQANIDKKIPLTEKDRILLGNVHKIFKKSDINHIVADYVEALAGKISLISPQSLETLNLLLSLKIFNKRNVKEDCFYQMLNTLIRDRFNNHLSISAIVALLGKIGRKLDTKDIGLKNNMEIFEKQNPARADILGELARLKVWIEE